MIIKVTSLAFKEGVDGEQDSLEKKTSLVETNQIEQVISAVLKKDLPIIGEINKTDATQIMFRSGRFMTILETVEQVAELIK